MHIEQSMIAERPVENPHTTWAQTLHELEHKVPYAGQNRVSVNLKTLMGGFCKFRGTQAQQRAAAQFKSLHERSQIGSLRAIDPGVEAVDGGGNRDPELGVMAGADARDALDAARDHLGRVDYRCAEYVVIGEHGPTAYASFRMRDRQHRPDGRAVSRYSVEMRDIMDRLALLWGHKSTGVNLLPDAVP